MLAFHVKFNLARPVGETSQSPQRGRAVLLFRTTPATIYTIAKAGAMLLIGQERSIENGGLSCRATSCLGFWLDHTISGELSNGVSGSYNHRKAVAARALEKAEYVLFHLPPGIGVGAFAFAPILLE
jgi:hypothetical protein